MLRFFDTLKDLRCTGIRPDEPLAVIGDIHGCIDRLEPLLEKIMATSPDARIIVAGDMIDRGPNSRDVLARVRGLTQAGAVTIMGNHERMLLNVFDAMKADLPSEKFNQTMQRWLRAGGTAVLDNYGLGLQSDDEAHFHTTMMTFSAMLADGTEAWLRALPPIWASGNVAIVHAGANPRASIYEQNPDHCVWGHAGFGKFARQDNFWIVRGHEIVKNPTVRKRIISIDTGAYRTGILTAAIIHPDQVHFLTTSE